MRRRLFLVKAMRTCAEEILPGEKEDGNGERSLSAPCVGPLLATDVMFQTDEMAELLATAAVIAGDRRAPPPSSPPPLSCAALLSCHRVHLGPIARDVALAMTVSAAPSVRRRYLSSLLLSYAQALTATLELLDVDWSRQFGVTFAQLLRMVYDQLPAAAMRAILLHMRLTDPAEIATLSAVDLSKGSRRTNSRNRLQRRSSSSSSTFSTCQSSDVALNRHFWLPLTPARMEFMVGLTDLILKVV